MRPHHLYFLIFSIPLILSFSDLHAQIIKGQIMDSETKEPIPYANVYFNASTHGTTSDQHGTFELDTDGYAGQDIVISCVGYDTWIIDGFEDNKFYHVYLKPSSKLLKEIVIIPDELSRKLKEKLFLEQFLGTSRNAKRCDIENLKDVILVYFKSTSTLEAYCYEPLIIHNKALGYKIKYYLDVFKFNKENMFYQGNFLFEEVDLADASEQEKVIRRRRNAYYGSRMHFFRVLWNGEAGNTDFYLETIDSKKLVLDDLVSEETNDLKYFYPQDMIKIYYKHDISTVESRNQKSVPFNQSGFFDSNNILWNGKMAEQRIGDLLPFEYWPYE